MMSTILETEKLITLPQAAAYLNELLPAGTEPVSNATVYRWASHGCRGRKLESVRIGKRTLTSREAVCRFTSGGGEEEARYAAAPILVDVAAEDRLRERLNMKPRVAAPPPARRGRPRKNK